MSTSTGEIATAIRPFHVEFSEERIDDLRRRIAATRWPSKELVDERSQGVQLAAAQALARYWLDEYDFGRVEARLNELPQFVTQIDGVEIHFIHVTSSHENALPLIMTHGWPGSVIELLDAVGPLTDPTAHGGSGRGRLPSCAAVPPGVRVLRRAGGARLGSGPYRTGLGRADAPSRLHPLRRPGRRRGRRRHRCDGPSGTRRPARHPHQPAGARAGGTMPTNTDEERAAAAQIATFGQSGNGYFVEMATRPQTIGYALLDSPIALAAWMIDHDTDAYSRSRAPSSTGGPRATSRATTSSTTSRCTG